MKAIKIDVVEKTVTEVELEGGNPVRQKGEIVGYTDMLDGIYKAIGRKWYATAFDFGRGDRLLVSENALQLPPNEIPGWFAFGGVGEILAFNGVVINSTKKFERPPKITVAEVAARVRFLGKLAAPVDLRAVAYPQ
jgi:hypothetical protein